MAKSKQALRQTLLHALKVFAGKEADRDAIEPSDTPVNIEIRATVGRGAAANVTETIVGNLIVDADGETHNNVAAEQAEIVGYFLARLSDGARKAVLEEMPAAFLAAGGTLGVADKYVQAAEALLKALRFRSGSKVQRGKVTLNLIEHAADAGKAVKPRRRAA